MPNHTADIHTRRFQCRHIFTDGHRCGSACLKGEDFCYYHHTARRPKPIPPQDPYTLSKETSFVLSAPADLADRTGIQLAITDVLNKLAENQIDARRAGLLLYGLQIASHNLPRARPVEPSTTAQTVEEVTTDPVHGLIAPEAEVGAAASKPEGPLAQLLRKVRAEIAITEAERAAKANPAPGTLTLQAAGDLSDLSDPSDLSAPSDLLNGSRCLRSQSTAAGLKRTRPSHPLHRKLLAPHNHRYRIYVANPPSQPSGAIPFQT